MYDEFHVFELDKIVVCKTKLVCRALEMSYSGLLRSVVTLFIVVSTTDAPFRRTDGRTDKRTNGQMDGVTRSSLTYVDGECCHMRAVMTLYCASKPVIRSPLMR